MVGGLTRPTLKRLRNWPYRPTFGEQSDTRGAQIFTPGAPIMRTEVEDVIRTMGPNEFRQWFRTIEFFEGRGGWYFLSPDKIAVGPYESERTAERQAAKLAKILKNLDSRRSARTAVIEFTIEGC